EACCCGRPGRLVEYIDGRQEDCVITRSGCRLGRLDHIFKDCVRVREAQIRQEEPGHVTIWLVTAEGYQQADEEALKREIIKRVGDDLTFEIVHVDSIPRTRSGKLRFVVSDLTAAAA
ncbi:MAG: phenylacetate--CoA ligase family protein, partial [Maioricimonas sp. JB049]